MSNFVENFSIYGSVTQRKKAESVNCLNLSIKDFFFKKKVKPQFSYKYKANVYQIFYLTH